MKPIISDSALILAFYLQQEPQLLGGEPNPSIIIPNWFKRKNETLLFPEKKPIYSGPDSEEILARIASWLDDPCFDLPDSDFFTDVQNESLKAFQDQIEDWKEKNHEWYISQNLIQLRKWIYWLTRFSWMDITDGVAMEMAGLPSTVGDHIADRTG